MRVGRGGRTRQRTSANPRTPRNAPAGDGTSGGKHLLHQLSASHQRLLSGRGHSPSAIWTAGATTGRAIVAVSVSASLARCGTLRGPAAKGDGGVDGGQL